jgi:hypothetical protein
MREAEPVPVHLEESRRDRCIEAGRVADDAERARLGRIAHQRYGPQHLDRTRRKRVEPLLHELAHGFRNESHLRVDTNRAAPLESARQLERDEGVSSRLGLDPPEGRARERHVETRTE